MTEFITNLILITKDVFTGSIGFILFALGVWAFLVISGKIEDAIMDYIDKL